jgi:hypothetical protein
MAYVRATPTADTFWNSGHLFVPENATRVTDWLFRLAAPALIAAIQRRLQVQPKYASSLEAVRAYLNELDAP